MYVIYEKTNNKVYDFKADPSIYINSEKYGFCLVGENTMLNVYKELAKDKIAFFNPVDKKFTYKNKEDTPYIKMKKAMNNIKDYKIYTETPIKENLEEEILNKLLEDLNQSAIIVVKKGEVEFNVPEIDYI